MSWYRPILLRLTAYVLISTNTVAAYSICVDIDKYCCGLQHMSWNRPILLRLTAYVLISTNTVAAYSICLDIDKYCCGLQHMSWYRPILLRLIAYVLISTNTLAAYSICLDIDQYCCGLQHMSWYRPILFRLTAYVLHLKLFSFYYFIMHAPFVWAFQFLVNDIQVYWVRVRGMVYIYFSYIVVVGISIIVGGYQSTRRKPSTCRKSLTTLLGIQDKH
jgi:hypothetical protein